MTPRNDSEKMRNALDVVHADLKLITDRLEAEFAAMSGGSLLIAGGAGFLGHYLVQSALHWNTLHPDSAPIEVVVLDSYVRGVPPWLKALERNRNLYLARHDITRPIPEGLGRFTYFIHAASIASPIYYRKRPIETMDANVGGLRHMLDYASIHPLKGMLFYSSSEIYGDPTLENIPTPETYRGNVSCTGPRACYDESKRYGETLCVNFAQQRGVPVKVARPFNNYGIGLKLTDGRVIPDFARNILAEKDIVMLSDGSPKRTYCYVADAVIGYYKILVNGRSGEAYNIGVEKPEISVAELAETMVRLARDLFGYRGKVVRGKSPDADYLIDNPNRRCPVIEKARRELGYDPTIDLEKGLRRSLTWYAENREAAEA